MTTTILTFFESQTPSTNLSLCPEDVYSSDQRNYRFYANAPIRHELFILFDLIYYLFGIISNLINIVVFLDFEMRQQLVNHFLLVLSISDILLLLCNFFFLVLPVVVVETDSFFWNDFFPYIIRYSYPLALTAQTIGVYLTVLVSFHRFLGVCHPFKARRWVSIYPVEFAIVGSILFGFAINIPTWLELGVVSCLSSRFNQISRQIQLASFHDMNYILIKKCIAYTILMFIVPFGVLITVQALRFSSRMRQRSYSTTRQSSNDNIVRQLHLLRKSRHSEVFKTISKISYSSLLKPSSELFKPKFSNSTRDRSITIMLLAIVALFLLCNGLAFLNSIIESIMLFENDEANRNILPASNSTNQFMNNLLSLNHNLTSNIHMNDPNIINIHVEFDEDLSQKMIKWFERSVEISNVLITLNSSTSTLVYLIFSSKYRLIFKSLFGLSKRQKFNLIALTTAVAARRVVELSLIPEEVESRSRRKQTKLTNTEATATTPLNDGSFKSVKYSIRERFDSQSSNYSAISSTRNRLSGGYKRTASVTLNPNRHLMPISNQQSAAAVMRESQSSVQFSNLTSVTQRSSDQYILCHFRQKDTPSVIYRSNGSRSLTNSESNLRLMDNNEEGTT